MEDDWVELWQIAVAGGFDEGANRVSVIDFVLRSVEPGLRDGQIVAGRVLHAPPKVGFERTHLPVEDVLTRIRDVLMEDEFDSPEVDLWFAPGARFKGH